MGGLLFFFQMGGVFFGGNLCLVLLKRGFFACKGTFFLFSFNFFFFRFVKHQ